MEMGSAENIAFLLDSAPRNWSSQEDRHLLLCQELIKRGSQPVLVFSKTLPPEIEDRFIKAGVQVAAIDYGQGFLHYFKELGRLQDRFKITAVHIIFFDYFSAICWLARIRGVKHIIYEMQNGGVFKAQSWKKQLLHLRNRIATNPTTKIIAISNFIKSLLTSAGVTENKIFVRYLGIDTERFKPDEEARKRLSAEYDLNRSDLILSTVSYLRPIKNPQTIVEACGLLAARNVSFRLLVAGDGEMLTELKELSHRLNIADRILWLGLVPDPSSLLQASDLFLLTTVGEAFGLVLAEAMACGVPVVATRSGGIIEVIDDGKTGLLVPPLDPAALADAMEQLACDPARRHAMGVAGRQRVLMNFTVGTAVQNTIRLYESLGIA
jgi:glycosyltransferase involved in cell wall biosynthesis